LLRARTPSQPDVLALAGNERDTRTAKKLRVAASGHCPLPLV
jgi:hypothetical protein